MKAFVTGSTGLLGNNLVRLLLDQGHDVTGLVRSREKGKWLLGDTAVGLVCGDMRDVTGFADSLEEHDIVFHTAAYFREYFQPGNHAQSIQEINVRGVLALLNEADRRGVRRFLQVSSSGSVGMKPDGSPGDEDTSPHPLQRANLYFRSKVEADAAIKAWRPQRGLEVIEVLPGWMWGPGDAGPTSAGRMALHFVAGRLPAMIDGGICVVDARDVAAAMIVAVEKGKHGDRYIVGGKYHTLGEIFQGLERVSGVRAPRLSLPYTLTMAYAWIEEWLGRLTGKEVLMNREGIRTTHAKLKVTSEKAVRELGVSFRPLDETLRDVVEWYGAHPFPRGGQLQGIG